MVTEKAMAPHSSTLAWKIPWTEEPGRLQSMGSWRVGHDWATSLSLSLRRILQINLKSKETWDIDVFWMKEHQHVNVTHMVIHAKLYQHEITFGKVPLWRRIVFKAIPGIPFSAISRTVYSTTIHCHQLYLITMTALLWSWFQCL